MRQDALRRVKTTAGGEKRMPTCDRCGFTRSRFEGGRFWSGNWTERQQSGRETYRTLCDDCHREVVREN
jgi:hypothetical protein